MSNYSVLQQNTLLGLSEAAGILYLRLLDQWEGHNSRANEIRCFLAACRFEREVAGTLHHILTEAPKATARDGTPVMRPLDPKTLTDLSHFFAERWRHNFMERQAA